MNNSHLHRKGATWHVLVTSFRHSRFIQSPTPRIFSTKDLKCCSFPLLTAPNHKTHYHFFHISYYAVIISAVSFQLLGQNQAEIFSFSYKFCVWLIDWWIYPSIDWWIHPTIHLYIKHPCWCRKHNILYKDHPVSFVCPNLLIAICETSYMIRRQFIEWHSVHCLFVNLFIYIWGATSELQLIK
jgi:hypothetical protein